MPKLFSLAGVLDYIDQRYPGVEGFCTSRCQTGDRYVTLGQETIDKWNEEFGAKFPGTIRDGARFYPAFDEETAASSLMAAFDEYEWHLIDRGLERPNAMLYWRLKPTRLESRILPGRGGKRVWIRARLVITDKPPIYETIEHLRAA